MIAKIPPKRRDGKSSFKELLDYCLGVTGHSTGSVLHTGVQNLYCVEDAYIAMEDTAQFNTRCVDPVFHFILSWREFEAPSNEQVDEAVAIALQELDLQECQALWALQSDTENIHVHVTVNRIHPETYRAVTPAKGWTKKALERAARKIEASQGWDIELSGRYEVSADGSIIEKKQIDERKLSSKAADIEAHTGIETLESTAKEKALPPLRSAQSWEELHRALAAHGFEIEKKGKGAVIRSGEFAVKLSTLARDCSLSKLEARLGEYQLRRDDIQIKAGYELKSVYRDGLFSELWERYTKEREKYLEEKAKAFSELRAFHRQETADLYAAQRASRAEFFGSENWKGRGAELNALRSFTALANKKERLELRDAQKEDITALRVKYPKRFMSFKRWLAVQEDDSLFLNYRYADGNAAPSYVLTDPRKSSEADGKRPETRDIRDYTAKIGGKNSVLYCRAGNHTADFEDLGRSIMFNRRRIDEVSVTAALQLAAQKWGSVQITGSDKEYRELCVSLALKHGIKLANEDLAAEVERRRAEQRQQQTQKPTPLPSSRPSADVKEISEADIKALKLISDDARIYLNPRTDNQKYDGPILHVDRERGFCVQQIGRKLLFVHKLEKFETVPEVGKDISIFYKKDEERARVALKAAVMTRKIRR